jgi:hypothetical protein
MLAVLAPLPRLKRAVAAVGFITRIARALGFAHRARRRRAAPAYRLTWDGLRRRGTPVRTVTLDGRSHCAAERRPAVHERLFILASGRAPRLDR